MSAQRFPRMAMFNTAEECATMQMTHMPFADPPEFGSFMLHGSDKEPVQIDLYKNVKPDYNEHPIAVYRTGEDGTMVRQ